MKLITGLTLAAMLSTGALAQTPPPLPPPANTPSAPPQTPAPMPPEVSAPATNTTPSKTAAKKKSAKKKTTAKKPAAPTPEIAPAAPLVVNEPAVARQNNVNIRGQAKINSEIVARLKQGETVTVLEEITLPHPKTDEPAKWAKIAMPAAVHVFVNTPFLDDAKAVKPAKLNVRTGPGENFSVVGTLHKGDTVKEVGVKGDWTEIEPPAGTFAFVAAHLLSHKEAEAPVPAPIPPTVAQTTPATTPTAPPPIPPTTTEVTSTTPTIAPGADAQNPPTTPTPVPTPPPDQTAAQTITPAVPEPMPPPVEEPAKPRIVQREGIVRGTVSIQAPSYYELESLDTGKVTEYLYTSSTNLPLRHWKGKTVLVTGEIGLDERWPNTPVISIQKIQLVQ